MSKITIACVLKTGGVYTSDYVNALAYAMRRHVTIPYEFACLTDNSAGFGDGVDQVIPLKHGFPGWWSKIELFRPDIFEDKQIFFFDLDTVILDNIDNVVQCKAPFAALRDFNHHLNIGSGLMSWKQGSLTKVYDEFMVSPYRGMKTFGGDQTWIDARKPSIQYLQDLYPNAIVSFKKHCMNGSTKNLTIPKRAKIVCFHGVPKPHSITNPLIAEHWRPKLETSAS